MANKEQDLRLGILNNLLTTPHRQLNLIWPVHREMCEQDPLFYSRLAAWYTDQGEVRDHREMFVVTLSLSDFEGHRDDPEIVKVLTEIDADALEVKVLGSYPKAISG